MTKQERQDKARALHSDHCNCCQSVVLAYADHIGIDEASAQRLCAPFGRGLSGMGELCGCVVGTAMVAGLTAHNEAARPMAEGFREEFGDVVCSRLLQHCKVPCREKIAFAAGQLHDILND